jgi:hypothetical protein
MRHVAKLRVKKILFLYYVTLEARDQFQFTFRGVLWWLDAHRNNGRYDPVCSISRYYY